MKLKKSILALLLMQSLLPLQAREKADTAYIFRFVPRNDMFYVPWNGNGESLERLIGSLSGSRAPLEFGRMYVCVSSYSPTADAGQSADSLSRVRSSRVKSELIVRGKVTEAMFVTDRRIAAPYRTADGRELKDVVVVTFPASVEKVAELAGPEAAARVEAHNKEVSGEAERERPAAERAEAGQARETRPAAGKKAGEERPVAGRAGQEGRTDEEAARKAELEWAEAGRLAAEKSGMDDPTFSLRADLLRWATLTPALGIEWRIRPSWGILVDGSWTSWTWNGKDRRYALWEVSPEVRHYIGKERRGYLGAMYKAGKFNYKLSATGRQGDLAGGGITGGYRLRLNKTLSMDFNLGVGYIHADYEEYEVIDGVRVRQGDESRNWWGPVNAGVTLAWQPF